MFRFILWCHVVCRPPFKKIILIPADKTGNIPHQQSLSYLVKLYRIMSNAVFLHVNNGCIGLIFGMWSDTQLDALGSFDSCTD